MTQMEGSRHSIATMAAMQFAAGGCAGRLISSIYNISFTVRSQFHNYVSIENITFLYVDLYYMSRL